ncbi:GNAT family N-acetyltransferase [Planomicrobium sp. CPCC 101079]|uniref:GNAT family N-acetyltransferase n=1 Tax=Planomicrobium sp. CPCC 101079 TaxID=2599618 RepID=UPI0011B41A3E|nr:GNAT family N-acetyltransferase [Planomicrobium sp. CPCC 101079]TWT13341.1 GNAT family N-acetyltransferase [Planomicrobium sp. CPCC 101079]
MEIVKAGPQHVQGIIDVCAAGYWATYSETHSKEYIERVIDEFYNRERVLSEVTDTNRNWGGYFVALDGGEVVGAGGGGMNGEGSGEVFVLYLKPDRRNEGIGTRLLDAITKQQKEEFGAHEQWVSVGKGNQKGIPFYEAKGFAFQQEQQGYGNSKGENYISLRYYRNLAGNKKEEVAR